jgi:hypothetical protein
MKPLQINLHTKANSLGEIGEVASGPKTDENRTIFGAVYDTSAPENANDPALRKWKGSRDGRWLAAISGSNESVLIAVADDHEGLIAEVNRLYSDDSAASQEAAKWGERLKAGS